MKKQIRMITYLRSLLKQQPPDFYNNFSESSALILQGFQTPVSKNHPLFLQKRLTNHQKFAAKPIDFSLFQSTGGDFYVTC